MTHNGTLSDNTGEGFASLPLTPGQIFYRIPYLFLQKAKDRVQDAWESVAPVIDTLKKEARHHDIKGEEAASFTCEDGSRVEISTTVSDLWIKAEAADPAPASPFQKIDTLIKGLKKPAYKYICEKTRVLAFPLVSGTWGDTVKGFIGLDAGSISINIAFVDEAGVVFETDYTLTEGDVINNIKKAFSRLSAKLPANIDILGSGVTGSGHEISSALLGADVYETELDAHAEATLHLLPDTQVIFDIGGQDSKVMYIEDGELEEAGMNKKCGAGTGSFLDAQADRLGIPIEKFGETGLKAKKPYSFSSMCTVFVGRDLIAEQAKGNTKENIIAGLHRSLAMNFYATLGINKKHLKTPIAFQGGVASNIGVKKSLEDLLCEARGEKLELYVPMHHKVMGAIGMALFARDEVEERGAFRGIETIQGITSEFTECTRAQELGCNKTMLCDLVHLSRGGEVVQTLYACDAYAATPMAPSAERSAQ
ncbi:acyl-CoA dehydratase activase [Desulfoluna spongiiphila]|uniref:acyl-CoA dehydratase activase n=1 Tax=Desulfoluna spongiiphila TaxID=419481 RepID=UPI0012578C29|nr:acyl-CoA dehydratase activase [Desulfoluna spongiiphila]VVS91172.1 atpase badf/badg/bcra/bcrd type [Desulfoluna spongiiphila]